MPCGLLPGVLPGARDGLPYGFQPLAGDGVVFGVVPREWGDSRYFIKVKEYWSIGGVFDWASPCEGTLNHGLGVRFRCVE